MNVKPYANSIDYLEDAIGRYLPLLASRIAAEQDMRKPQLYAPSDEKTVGKKQRVAQLEAERCVKLLREQEKSAREEIEARLDATRTVRGDSGWSDMDLLIELNADARLVLTVLVAMSLGMAEDALDEVGVSAYGGVSVCDLMVILEAKTISDRMEIRRLIRDLCDQGHVVVEYGREQASPEDFNAASVALSTNAFLAILGESAWKNHDTSPNESH